MMGKNRRWRWILFCHGRVDGVGRVDRVRKAERAEREVMGRVRVRARGKERARGRVVGMKGEVGAIGSRLEMDK